MDRLATRPSTHVFGAANTRYPFRAFFFSVFVIPFLLHNYFLLNVAAVLVVCAGKKVPDKDDLTDHEFLEIYRDAQDLYALIHAR